MRLLVIGDIVGKPGVKIVRRAVPLLRVRERLDLVIANAENAADGSGLTPSIWRGLASAGVDGVTLGDHIYRRGEVIPLLKAEPTIVRPANFPSEAPGHEWMVLKTATGCEVAVFSLLGRVFMKPVDCPFKAAERVMKAIPETVKIRICDFHAEATSDKQLMGRLLDGRASAVLGTHTHVPTADETIFPGGTAFQCDIGMTGPYESILGRKIERVAEATVTFVPTQFDVATEDVRLSGTIVDIDETTGKATAIRRLVVRRDEVAEWEAEANQPAPPPLM
jgi:metallophosphoesterase (TIGR00282 family)